MVSPNLLYERLSPATFLTAVLRLGGTGEAVTNLPPQGWQEKIGGAGGRRKVGVLSGNKEDEERGKLKEAARERKGKSAGELFLLTGCLLIFLH